MKANLSFKGMEEYLEALAKAGRDIDLHVDDALTAGGEVALDGMRRRAPFRTGNLRSKLELGTPQLDGNFHFVYIGLLRGVDAETARYGNVQEFGSSNTQAQPYVRPTMDEDKRKIIAAEKDSLKNSGAL